MFRKPKLIAIRFVLLALVPGVLHATQSTPGVTQNLPLRDRLRTLNTIFSDYWEDRLKHDPEFASSIGDNRYNDQLSDYSVEAYNESLARGRAFLSRLGEVDTAGMSDQEQLSKELMVRAVDRESGGSQIQALGDAGQLSLMACRSIFPSSSPSSRFTSVKDYDDYIARLKKVPLAFQQITDNMSIGMDDHREPPAYLMEKVLVQVNTIANEKPEEGPFALPVQKFPASVSRGPQQARIKEELLAAITGQVAPAYVRFGKFLKSQYIPNGRNDPGMWALPDGEAYYRFLVKQSTTTDLTPAQIHQIGVDQVKQDEEQLLAIAKKLGFCRHAKRCRPRPKNNPKLYPTSKEQLLDAYRGYLDQMRPKLPQLFGRLAQSAAGGHACAGCMQKRIRRRPTTIHGTPDGSRPGTVYVNTYKFATRPLYEVEPSLTTKGCPGIICRYRSRRS